ncbi:MAG: hypothetical protein AB8H12_09185 [Lewinella sp.]
MLLHILHKGNFAKTAITLFERYCPGQSVYIFPGAVSDALQKQVPAVLEAWPGLLETAQIEKKLVSRIKEGQFKTVFIHSLTKRKAELTTRIKAQTEARVFWIFLGAELYIPLSNWGVYELYDQPRTDWERRFAYWKGELLSLVARGVGRRKAITRGINDVDFFCFWNHYDYQLLKKHFNTNCQHLDFLYYDLLVKNPSALKPKTIGNIMVNHSASISGNHLWVLEKLADIDPRKTLSITTPLSYGDATVRERTIASGQALWAQNYFPLTKYLPQTEYYARLNSFAAAIFGNRRQEAGANVFYLLAIGGKVFLRRDNTMLAWLREKGFILFCVETDLNKLSDLAPLSDSVAKQNRQRYLEVFSLDNERKMMSNLLKECDVEPDI